MTLGIDTHRHNAARRIDRRQVLRTKLQQRLGKRAQTTTRDQVWMRPARAGHDRGDMGADSGGRNRVTRRILRQYHVAGSGV